MAKKRKADEGKGKEVREAGHLEEVVDRSLHFGLMQSASGGNTPAGIYFLFIQFIY